MQENHRSVEYSTTVSPLSANFQTCAEWSLKIVMEYLKLQSIRVIYEQSFSTVSRNAAPWAMGWKQHHLGTHCTPSVVSPLLRVGWI